MIHHIWWNSRVHLCSKKFFGATSANGSHSLCGKHGHRGSQQNVELALGPFPSLPCILQSNIALISNLDRLSRFYCGTSDHVAESSLLKSKSDSESQIRNQHISVITFISSGIVHMAARPRNTSLDLDMFRHLRSRHF